MTIIGKDFFIRPSMQKSVLTERKDMSDISNAISVKELSHSYDRKKYVINDLSFDVKKGEIFGLLGQNKQILKV